MMKRKSSLVCRTKETHRYTVHDPTSSLIMAISGQPREGALFNLLADSHLGEAVHIARQAIDLRGKPFDAVGRRLFGGTGRRRGWSDRDGWIRGRVRGWTGHRGNRDSLAYLVDRRRFRLRWKSCTCGRKTAATRSTTSPST